MIYSYAIYYKLIYKYVYVIKTHIQVFREENMYPSLKWGMERYVNKKNSRVSQRVSLWRKELSLLPRTESRSQTGNYHRPKVERFSKGIHASITLINLYIISRQDKYFIHPYYLVTSFYFCHLFKIIMIVI